MAANAKCMRYGNKFQVENCDPQQTVLNRNRFPTWTTFIEHKGWTVTIIVNVCSGENEKRTQNTVEIGLLYVLFIIL